MRAGTPLTQLVSFDTGFPDGSLSWKLLDGQGTQLTTGTVTPAAGAASAVITVSAEDNVLDEDVLASSRELSWSYTVSGLIQSGQRRYRLEAFLPLGLAPDGVRRKLGLETHELSDEAIDLVSAYSRFREDVGAVTLAAVEGHSEIVACEAIEAMAALVLIPSLQISLAAKESSGTNQFQRAAIDWAAVRAQLELYIAEGYRRIAPSVDPTAEYSSLLITVVRSDPITGETPS